MVARRLVCAGALGLLVVGATPGCKPTRVADAAVPADGSDPTASDPNAGPTSPVIDADRERAEIPERYRWDLEVLFASDEAFASTLEATAEMRQRLATYEGELDRPQKLHECLKLYFETRLATNKLTLYADLRRQIDRKSIEAQDMSERGLGALHALMKQASFVRREVMQIDDRAMARAYRVEPGLAEYRPYLEELRRRRSRVLDAEAERVLALAGDNLWAEIDLNEIPSDIEKIYSALWVDMRLPAITDERGEQVQLTRANYGKYRASENRSVRREAVGAFLAMLRAHEHALAATLAGQLRFNVFLARARGYDTALEAYLEKDDIDPAVYTNLVRTIGENVAPLHRYMRLRKKLMGVDELHIYDLSAPMVAGVEKTVPYEEALTILPKALAPLGDEYLAALGRGLDPENRWVDVYPHKNKAGGAFSTGVFGVHPFVKMNYIGRLHDLSTLAHEIGHAVHRHLSTSNQPYITASYVPFIAETASTLNEKLLVDYLLEHADSDDERLAMLVRLVEKIRGTVYRQALFAEFELAAHTAVENGTPITAEFLNETYADLIRRYYGPDFCLGEDDVVEWAYVSHFYFKYYVYSYATGLSSGIALAERIKRGGPKAQDAYLGMLKGGSSKPPLELLRGAGVDLTKPDAIVAATKLADDTLARIEAILARRN
jgi:oligoendopeptidase F